MAERPLLAETYERIVRDQLPNLFRLYLNPYVAQTCLALERYVQSLWRTPVRPDGTGEPYQTFLANGFEEALSGGIKLARCGTTRAGRPKTGLVLDSADRLGPFASAPAGAGRVEFLPGLTVVACAADLAAAAKAIPACGFIICSALESDLDIVQNIRRDHSALLLVFIERARLVEWRKQQHHDSAPDIVIFDESFVNHDVPFGAFTARKALFDHWNRPAKSTFHSTTFQPNTISCLHFLKCLENADPEFFALMQPEFEQIGANIKACKSAFRRLYSPSLANAITTTGCDTPMIRASGDFVEINGRKVFDGVGGVACSVRGHNPPGYIAEMAALEGVDCEAEVRGRIRALTGLEHVLPAVSGASAVENALKIALIAQAPRRHVLALKSGFGGKTLFALTGTWNASYKESIDPLYADVLYVDPFAADAIAQIDAALAQFAVAVVQMELIQGVGGVRCVPESVVRHLDAGRSRHGYLLLIDEVQTGMYRTGPFTRSRGMGLSPDLLVVGKAVSDMMFPFALLAYSTALQTRLEQMGSHLPAAIHRQYAYPFGYRTVLNVLRFAEEKGLADQVAVSGALFAELLNRELATCKGVREVRVFGMLIGIELDPTGWPQRWFKKRLFWFYLFSMLQHPRYPVLVGFCQYEPHVLKITPPLTTDQAEIRQICATIADVLQRPFYRLLGAAVGGLVKTMSPWRSKHEQPVAAPHETVSR